MVSSSQLFTICHAVMCSAAKSSSSKKKKKDKRKDTSSLFAALTENGTGEGGLSAVGCIAGLGVATVIYQFRF